MSMFTLRDDQYRAIAAVTAGWSRWQRQLGIAATGAGRTTIFAQLAAAEPGRVLILTHREDLARQAAEQFEKTAGLVAGVDAGASIAPEGCRVVIATIQSMYSRLKRFTPDAFDLILIDEADHCLAEAWQIVLRYFSGARVLGITASPDRGDHRHLGRYFQGIAFEIGLLELIAAGHLAPLRAVQLPVEINGPWKRRIIDEDEAADLVSPFVEELAASVAGQIRDRKALVFLPRCDVSETFSAALAAHGIASGHLQRQGADVLAWFRTAGPGSALCQAMLLAEGYEQPDIDCIVALRPIQSRALYQQMVGRGLPLAPGKEFCLLIEPLWNCGPLPLCQAADLVAGDPLHRERLQAQLDAGHELGAELMTTRQAHETFSRRFARSAGR